MTVEELHSAGILFSFQIFCSMVVRLFTRTSPPSLKSAGCRPSGPGALSRFRIEISRWISVADGGLVSMFHSGLLGSSSGCVEGDQVNCSWKCSA
ncbi:glycine dehydrogenase, partial [Clonorchis sinensis]